MRPLASFRRDLSGASAAQYTLILALGGAGVAAGMFLLTDAFTGATRDAAGCIRHATACAPQAERETQAG